MEKILSKGKIKYITKKTVLLREAVQVKQEILSLKAQNQLEKINSYLQDLPREIYDIVVQMSGIKGIMRRLDELEDKKYSDYRIAHQYRDLSGVQETYTSTYYNARMTKLDFNTNN